MKAVTGKTLNRIAIPPQSPVLIAGPTASGKSALALEIAQKQGGVIINADALQVFDGWRVLTARPPDEDLALAKHALYGHVPFDQNYSVGQWLRDLEPLLSGQRPIIVGGTGLYFSALTEGLAEIPATDPKTREQADQLSHEDLIKDLDPETAAQIDLNNRVRVQRAWEVLTQTGRPLIEWQQDTPAPRLPLSATVPILLNAPKDWLTPRIERRFDIMLNSGALAEAQAMLATWDEAHPSSKAIGAAELIAYISGKISIDDAKTAAVIATRQYAKRQRTWFAKRMKDWHHLSMPDLNLEQDILFKE